MASWCTGGGNAVPHRFHRQFLHLPKFRGVCFVVEDWFYASWQIDYLMRDLVEVPFALLVWINVRLCAVARTEQDFRTELHYKLSDSVPVRFQMIDFEKDREKMLDGLTWLLSTEPS